MRHYGYIQVISIIGLLGGLAAIVSISVVGDTFGLPGSGAYRIYETFNRAMALLIVLQACALVGFHLRYQDVLDNVERIAVLIALLAWGGMAAGTAAEFWLYSDLPYGASNLQSTAFSIFSISSLIVGLALLALGLKVFVHRKLPRCYAFVLMLYLPIDIALFIADQSIFLASALTSIAFAFMTIRSRSASAAPSQELA